METVMWIFVMYGIAHASPILLLLDYQAEVTRIFIDFLGPNWRYQQPQSDRWFARQQVVYIYHFQARCFIFCSYQTTHAFGQTSATWIMTTWSNFLRWETLAWEKPASSTNTLMAASTPGLFPQWELILEKNAW